MRSERRKKLILDDPDQFGILSSPRRLEIITSLGDIGPASIAQLSVRLGLSSHSLYYHVHLLERAGVIAVHEVRKRARKEEAVYKLVADRILLNPKSGSVSQIEAAQKSLVSILRLTSREVYQALLSESKRQGTGREIYGVRFKARLGSSELGRLNRHLDQIEKILRGRKQKNQKGKLFSLTVVLTPSLIKGKKA